MQKILDGILEAIADEVRAQKHYQLLSDNAEDPKVNKFFKQLKRDEEEHEQALRARYEAFMKLQAADQREN